MAAGRRFVFVLVLNLLANALGKPAGVLRKRGADNNEVDSKESLVVDLPTNVGESDQSTTTVAIEPSTNALKVEESTNSPSQSDPKPVVLSAQSEEPTPAPEVIKDIFGSPSSTPETDSDNNDDKQDDDATTTTTTTESSDDDGDDDDDDDDDDSFEFMNTAPSGGGSNILSLLRLANAFFPSSSGAMIRNMLRDYVTRNFRGALTFSPLEIGLTNNDDIFGHTNYEIGHINNKFGSRNNSYGHRIDGFERRIDAFDRSIDDHDSDEYDYSVSNEFGVITDDIVHRSDNLTRRSGIHGHRADNSVNKGDELNFNNDDLTLKSDEVSRKGGRLNEIDTDYTVLRPPPPPFAHQEIESEEENGSDTESESESESKDDDDSPKDNNAAEASVEGANDDDDADDNDDDDNDDFDSNEPPEGGGGGGILGLLAGLSGGEDGQSDLGSLLAAVSGIVASLSGDGVDVNALIASGIGLFVGLLSEGEENVGGVLASYLLTSLDSLSGGGAKNNGAFFGTFLSKLIKGTSAGGDPDASSEEENAPAMADSAGFLLSFLMGLSGDMSKGSSGGRW